jgi:molecular chaperone Hsp33
MVEENLKNLESLSQAVATDSNPTLLLAKIFNNTTFTILEEKALSFSCNCSKERILRAFRLLGEQEISLMINEDHGAKVNCDFCNAEYVFSEDELKELL